MKAAVVVAIAAITILGACSPTSSQDAARISTVTSSTAHSDLVTETSTTTTAYTTTTVRTVATAPMADPPPPSPGLEPPPGDEGIAIVALGGATLFSQPAGTQLARAQEGLIMAVQAREGDWFRLLTPCDTFAWVQAGEVLFEPQRTGSAEYLTEAVIVLDPGHGGPNRGATGPTGLGEPEVNLDIARRTRDLLQSGHNVDWETGAVVPGAEYGPVEAVYLTRVEGPIGADYEAGLLFRAELAAAAGADAMLSIHNNADPDGEFDGPGSEVFYSIVDEESKRLAGLVVEEFRRGFAKFDVAWVGDTDAGAKYRLNDEGGDYYGVLRMSKVPTVITEGAFISNPDEEALLLTADFRQAYAEALYRAIVRFVETDAPGSGFTEPYPRTIPSGSGAPLPTCGVPEQP